MPCHTAWGVPQVQPGCSALAVPKRLPFMAPCQPGKATRLRARLLPTQLKSAARCVLRPVTSACRRYFALSSGQVTEWRCLWKLDQAAVGDQAAAAALEQAAQTLPGQAQAGCPCSHIL